MSCIKNPPIVAALAYDGVIKLWYVDDVECEETDPDIIEEGMLVLCVELNDLVKIK